MDAQDPQDWLSGNWDRLLARPARTKDGDKGWYAECPACDAYGWLAAGDLPNEVRYECHDCGGANDVRPRPAVYRRGRWILAGPRNPCADPAKGREHYLAHPDEMVRTDPDGMEEAGIFLSRLLTRRGLEEFGLCDSELYDLYDLVKAAGLQWKEIADSGGGYTLLTLSETEKDELIQILELPEVRERFTWAQQLAHWTRTGTMWRGWV